MRLRRTPRGEEAGADPDDAQDTVETDGVGDDERAVPEAGEENPPEPQPRWRARRPRRRATATTPAAERAEEPPSEPERLESSTESPVPSGTSWLAELEPDPRPPPTYAVAGEGIYKRFGEGEAAVEALRDVSVAFVPATFNAIMGPSGSGKSTLMHILAGLDAPSAGSVVLGGVALEGLSDRQLTGLRRRHVGFVFQAFNLLPVLSAEENVALPLRLAGERPDPEWLEALLEAFGLADRRTHRPSELSGGQQQRAAIARALVTRPSVVFADEPTGNLDSATSEEVLDLLRLAVEEFERTIVMVTHDQRAAAHADRVVLLEDGCVAGEERGAEPARPLRRMAAAWRAGSTPAPSRLPLPARLRASVNRRGR